MRFCIRWSDLVVGLFHCLTSRLFRSTDRLPSEVVTLWPQNDQLMVSLSVRSGFDLLIQALQLPKGSEVLLSALTVPHMPRIVENAGLIPVAVDLEPGGFRIDTTALRKAITQQSRILVVAHLFGDLTPMEPILQIAREHDLVVVEDCAQSFSGPGTNANDLPQYHPQSDVAMFSFGPIKTRTALQGAVVKVSDARLLNRMQSIQANYPRASSFQFLRRIVRYCFLKWISGRLPFGILVRICRATGQSYDSLLNNSSRNFSDDELFDQLRRQPSVGLLRLMQRRFSQVSCDNVRRRIELGRRLDASLNLQRSEDDVYWVYPLIVNNPPAAVNALRDAGFDATVKCRLSIVEATTGETTQVETTYANTIFIPWYAALTESAVDQMAQVVRPFVIHCRSSHDSTLPSKL